jgi:8-oxo-dGTP pyrophosphatase MutT (NUDIX family)
MECVNCGKKGHSFRDCKEPTSSFGVVATRSFVEDDRTTMQYLLIRRRDSLGYVDFLRGKYSLVNRSYIETLLNQMTVEERQRLLSTPFDILWTNLWNGQNTRQFRSEYESAKRTFEALRSTGDVSGRLLSKYISECKTTWEEPEWGFPKGRRSPYESELACAIREFCEETGLSSDTLTIMSERTPEVEEYTGSNSIRYKHIYYFGECSSDVALNSTNRVQTREVGDIGWFTFEEAYLKIRATNPEKRAILGRMHHILSN